MVLVSVQLLVLLWEVREVGRCDHVNLVSSHLISSSFGSTLGVSGSRTLYRFCRLVSLQAYPAIPSPNRPIGTMQSSSVPVVAGESSSPLSGPQARQAFELVESCFGQIVEQQWLPIVDDEAMFATDVAGSMLARLDEADGIVSASDSHPVSLPLFS